MSNAPIGPNPECIYTEPTKPTVVGPCSCGGYGVVYDEETAEEMGRCHEELDRLEERDRADA